MIKVLVYTAGLEMKSLLVLWTVDKIIVPVGLQTQGKMLMALDVGN